jgi:DNA-binding CsgD family transcriptional regulator
MESIKRPDRALALAVVGLSALWLLTAISFPVASRRLAPGAALAIGAMAIAHAMAYWHADLLRERLRFSGYAAVQLAIVFGIAISGALFPFGLALLIAFTARTVTGQSASTGATVTLSSFATFLVAAIATSDLYRGATAGLLLAATGVVAWSISLAVNRRPMVAEAGAVNGAPVRAASRSSNGRATELTARELEVLRMVASGSRTTDVAATMGIAERTVKSHLAAIYQKLGVENRAAAVNVAMRMKLL